MRELSEETYGIHEMFHSLKGEGLYTGVPMVFLRFSSCNRSCEFCDTPRPKEARLELTIKEILHTLHTLSPTCKRVVITGGEPFHQSNLPPLLSALQRVDYTLHFESNGDLLPKKPYWDIGKSWVAISPKKWLVDLPPYVDEVKWLVGDGYEFWKMAIAHQNEYPPNLLHILQPVWEESPSVRYRNLATAIYVAKEHPLFRLGTQQHKQWGIR